MHRAFLHTAFLYADAREWSAYSTALEDMAAKVYWMWEEELRNRKYSCVGQPFRQNILRIIIIVTHNRTVNTRGEIRTLEAN